MSSIEALNCAECPLSNNGSMCSSVALRSLAEIARLEYDTSSDMRAPGDIVKGLADTDPDVDAIRRLECSLRLANLANTQSGYAPVVY